MWLKDGLDYAAVGTEGGAVDDVGLVAGYEGYDGGNLFGGFEAF
jgi:hypothetical protein